MLSGSNMYFFPFKDRLNRELEMQNEVKIEEEEGQMENKIESNTFGTQVQSAAVLHDRSQHFSSRALCIDRQRILHYSRGTVHNV